MRAITLWNPWARLLISGAKKIETRNWPCECIGATVALHAAKKQDEDSIALCFTEPFRSALVADGIEKPGDMTFGDYSDGRYGWGVTVIERFAEPIPARGMQKFWRWERPAVPA